MKVAAKAQIGDKVRVLIANKWHVCRVVNLWWWSHYSGNSYPAYMVRFEDSNTMQCGNNSIRKVKERIK